MSRESSGIVSASHIDELTPHGSWQHRQVHSQGQRFAVAECGVVGDPMVLLLHSSTGGWFDWSDLLVPLAEQGYHVVAPSLRGWGDSDRTPTGYRADTAADDMAGLIRSLGHSNALIIGHDLGGVLAWTMASRHPRLIRAIAVLSAPHPLLWNPHSLVMRHTAPPSRLLRHLCRPRPSTTEAQEQLADILLNLAGPEFRDTDQWVNLRTLHRISLTAGAYGPARSHLSWLARPWSPGRREWLARLQEASFVARRIGGTPPAFVIGGQDDPIAPPVLMRTSAELSATEVVDSDPRHNSTLIIDNCGHFPQYEQPDAVAAALAEWAKNTC